MKLVIQIPCYNEEQTLPATLADLPRKVQGFDEIEVLVIDDGSLDDTAAVAESCGVDHLVRFPQHRGLARAFAAGLEASLRMGADVIVNTDGDNQYRAACIPALVRPVLGGDVAMVIGDRRVARVPEFSTTKKLLQILGSWVMRRITGLPVADATSGFRAFSRKAALGFVVTDQFTYTLETLIQAGAMGLTVVSVPVETNAKRRQSRLFRKTWHYRRPGAA